MKETNSLDTPVSSGANATISIRNFHMQFPELESKLSVFRVLLECEPKSCELRAKELRTASERFASCKLQANELRVYYIVSQRVVSLPQCDLHVAK